MSEVSLKQHDSKTDDESGKRLSIESTRSRTSQSRRESSESLKRLSVQKKISFHELEADSKNTLRSVESGSRRLSNTKSRMSASTFKRESVENLKNPKKISIDDKDVKKKLSIKIKESVEIADDKDDSGSEQVSIPTKESAASIATKKSDASSSKVSSKFSSIARMSVAARRTLRFQNSDDRLSQQSSMGRRITRMFQSNLRPTRRSSFVQPVLRYLPTYRLESQNPFNPRVVEDIIKKVTDEQMEIREGISFFGNALFILVHSLSEELLSHVKARNYDRYRILVNVTVGEKKHESYNKSVFYLWDAAKDSMATYVYEDRPDVFVIATVYGVYYD